MKEFLKKIKLIKTLSVELEMDQNEFVNRFRENVDPGNTGDFSDTFEVFSSSKNTYKGSVAFDKFDIKKKRKFFDNNGSLAVAKGTITKSRNALIINTEINGFSGKMRLIFIMLIAFYALFFLAFAILPLFTGNGDFTLAIPFLILHGLFMFGIPYFLMRRSVTKLKHELERKFFFFTKKAD